MFIITFAHNPIVIKKGQELRIRILSKVSSDAVAEITVIGGTGPVEICQGDKIVTEVYDTLEEIEGLEENNH